MTAWDRIGDFGGEIKKSDALVGRVSTFHKLQTSELVFLLATYGNEGSIGLAKEKMKIFFCLFSLFRTFYD
jgi:hypothetical protein